jgi:hypothetical protein
LASEVLVDALETEPDIPVPKTSNCVHSLLLAEEIQARLPAPRAIAATVRT